MRPLALASWGCGVLIGTWLALGAAAPFDLGAWFRILGALLSSGLVFDRWRAAGQDRRVARGAHAAPARIGWIDTGALARHVLALLSGGLLAWGGVHERSWTRLEGRLPVAITAQGANEPVNVWWPVVIDEMPARRPQGLRFRARPQADAAGWAPTSPCAAADPSALQSVRRLQINWYAGAEQAPPPDLRAGQVWCLPLRLKRPHGLSNPVGFDVELWLFQLDIGAVGSVRGADAPAAHRLADQPGYRIERLRQSVREAIAREVDSPALAGVLAALAVGDQSSIESDDWDVFRRTGVAHLMAISGVHVTLFAWLAGGLAGRLWRCFPRGLLWCPAGRVGRWLGVAAATAYALLAGWGVPAQRTVWMLLVWATLRSLEARWSGSRVLLVAACVVALFDPWALYQPGFWLSFCAVALLMMQGEPAGESGPLERARGVATAFGWRQRLWAACVRLCTVQCLTSIVLAPLGLIFFGQVSLVGLGANLVAIPWVTWVVTPLALLGTFWGGLWTVAAQAVAALMAVLEWLGRWPLAAWHAAAGPVWLQGLGLLGAVLLASPGPAHLRLLGLPLIAAMALPAPELPALGSFTLWAFDIGQGNAVLVRTRRHALLFDAGPKYWTEGDAGERVVVPQLHALGVTSLDRLVLSHRDTDHVGGAASVLQALKVHQVMSSLESGHPLRMGGPHQPCVAGLQWAWEGVHFEILHPSEDLLAAGSFTAPLSRMKPNALSCVLSVRAGARHVLLTGDIERAQEQALLDRAGDRLPADVLLVPHHGSRTSSSAAFLAAIRPRHAVVQAGHLNRFGHPAREVLERYRRVGASVVRTDQCGAWRWESATGVAECTRTRQRRLWHTDGHR